MSATDELAELFIHTVTAERFEGTGAYGDQWGDESEPIACFVDESRRLVRDQHGAEVVSETTVLAPLDAAAEFPPRSRVHLPGRVATVITCSRWDGDALDLPSHTEVTLT